MADPAFLQELRVHLANLKRRHAENAEEMRRLKAENELLTEQIWSVEAIIDGAADFVKRQQVAAESQAAGPEQP